MQQTVKEALRIVYINNLSVNVFKKGEQKKFASQFMVTLMGLL